MAGELTGAAQGAAIGTTIMPGWGTAIGAVAGAFMGGGSGGSGASNGGATATPSATQAAVFGSGLDGSGWMVNFGNGATQTLDNRQDKTIRSTGPTADARPSASFDPYLSSGGGDAGGLFGPAAGVPQWVWLFVAGAVAFRFMKKK